MFDMTVELYLELLLGADSKIENITSFAFASDAPCEYCKSH
jgi:hypothetical protein